MGGDNYLGNATSLTCTVEAQGANASRFVIVWTYSHTKTNISKTSTNTSQSLWFDSLSASHAGIYVCNASLTPTTGSEQTNITLQCKPKVI